jgi:hypothetical protein
MVGVHPVNTDKLVRLLIRRPANSPTIVNELGISQPSWEWAPNLGAKLELCHLSRCYQMAVQLWTDVLINPLVSDAFKRDIAGRHLSTLRSINPGK